MFHETKDTIKYELSKFFEHLGNSDTGQQLLTNYLLFFLWTSTMFSFFQLSGKMPHFRQLWNIIESCFIMDGLLSVSILIEIPSYSWALFASNDWIVFSSFSLSKVASLSLFSLWYVLGFGRGLLFCRGWHYLLNRFLMT